MADSKTFLKFNMNLVLQEVDVIEAINCGMATQWMIMEDEDGNKISIHPGLDANNKWLQIRLEDVNGECRYFRADVSSIGEFLLSLLASTEEIIKSRGGTG